MPQQATTGTEATQTATATAGTASYGRRVQEDIGVTVDSARRAQLDAGLAEIGSEFTKWAACTQDLKAAGAVLPCRTSGNPIRCVDGARHCGTALENTREPFLELDFHDYTPDFNGRMYLFMVHLKIPEEEEYGKLLFHPLEMYGGDTVENRGWRLEVFDDHHHPMERSCIDWNYGSSATEHAEGLTDVQHHCLSATAENEDYEVMSKVRFLRITLIGQYRQLWLNEVNVYFRAIADLGSDGDYVVANAPPPPPPTLTLPNTPPAPPDPIAPSSGSCVFYPLEAQDGWETAIVAREPCGLTKQACCDHAHTYNTERGAVVVKSFVLTASGCCNLVSVGWDGVAVAYGVGGAGSGVVV